MDDRLCYQIIETGVIVLLDIYSCVEHDMYNAHMACLVHENIEIYKCSLMHWDDFTFNYIKELKSVYELRLV